MRFLVLVVPLAAFAASIPGPPSLMIEDIVHEQRQSTGSEWELIQPVDAGALLPMRVGLLQDNLHRGNDLLKEISHPSSSRFGQHFSVEELNDLFAPKAETVDAVLAWLLENDIDRFRIAQSDNKGWLAFDATKEEAERLLQTEYHVYEHRVSGDKAIGCEEYKLPLHIRPHVDYITPGVGLRSRLAGEKVKRASKAISSRASPVVKRDFKPDPNDTTTCDQAITPACIRALYQIPINTLNHSGNELGLFETGDFYAQKDIDSFFSDFEPRIPNGTHPILQSIDGGKAPVAPKYADGESDLDIDIAFPLIWPQSAKIYQTDDRAYTVNGGGGLFNTFLDAIDGSYCTYSAFGEKGNDPNFDDVYPHNVTNGYNGKLMCGKYKLTNVISISYSLTESNLPYYYQQRQCNEFMKLALQGHTIIVASGDSGVSGRSFNPAPNGCLGKNHTIFNPEFPSCPYITTVGATQVAANKTIHDPETAAYNPSHDGSQSSYSSGGGFSNIYSIPDYQKSALATYFSKHSPSYKSYSALHNATHNDTTAIGANGGVYNRIGRGMPDVSAVGQRIASYADITYKGGYALSEGTSASAPLFASIVNNINEHRLAAGKKPIGFLNHILYSNPDIFNDITNGTNPGCKTEGFSAVPGWDPVTGLGTPNYPKMLKLFMSLP